MPAPRGIHPEGPVSSAPGPARSRTTRTSSTTVNTGAGPATMFADLTLGCPSERMLTRTPGGAVPVRSSCRGQPLRLRMDTASAKSDWAPRSGPDPWGCHVVLLRPGKTKELGTSRTYNRAATPSLQRPADPRLPSADIKRPPTVPIRTRGPPGPLVVASHPCAAF